MKRLGKRGYQILKIFHILFTGIWIGAVVTAILLLITLNAEYLIRDLELILFIDLAIFIPCAIATLLSGIIFSIFTQWGLSKHWWILAKYLINIFPIFTGYPLVASKLLGMIEIVKQHGTGAMTDTEFNGLGNECLYALILYAVMFLFAYTLSVIKPRNKGKE
ncbi:MAG: hypothetical protein LBD21_09065 [Tannerellaceae bacterium]|jgi:hypothetical protein|nr:hypothetical protein [Tannerellaceae bacterium]